jgi:hypothetical protein
LDRSFAYPACAGATFDASTLATASGRDRCTWVAKVPGNASLPRWNAGVAARLHTSCADDRRLGWSAHIHTASSQGVLELAP